MTQIHGHVDEGFGLLRDAFKANFDLGRETGAACAVYHQGRLVADLYAGVANSTTGAPWTSGTLTIGFSATKGLMALCGYVAQQWGLMEFDAPVGSVWPEFEANGKKNVTIRDLFTHRSQRVGS